MFQSKENHVLKGATFKGKNMLPMRIENNFKGYWRALNWETAKSNYANMLVF